MSENNRVDTCGCRADNIRDCMDSHKAAIDIINLKLWNGMKLDPEQEELAKAEGYF